MSLLLFLFGKRKNKRGSLVIKSKEDGVAFYQKYVSVMTEPYHEQYENFSLGQLKSFSIPYEELGKWDDRLVADNKINDALSKTAELNNAGKELEKQGKIEEAIKVYEQNLTLHYSAAHSYDRLMILYRKRKQYTEELSVIDKAITCFSETGKSSLVEKWKERRLKVVALIEKSQPAE